MGVMRPIHVGSNEPSSDGGKWVDKYEYTPLKENEIRLLEIIPGDLADPLELRLHHVSLDDLPTYGALSYTWGTDMDDRFVFIDGKALVIKPNLEAALLEFRRKPPFKTPGLEKLWQALELSKTMLGKWCQEGILETKRGTVERPDAIQLLKASSLDCEKLVGEKIDVRVFLFYQSMMERSPGEKPTKTSC
jgi:hypothetical protein